MPEEIELKFLDINKKTIEAKLSLFKAKKLFSGKIKTLYFDFPDKSLSKENKILRLRERKGENVLTFKSPISFDGAKVMKEIEIPIEKPDELIDMLLLLGLKKCLNLTHSRTSYSLNNSMIEIDTYPEIPAYLEIEAPDLKTLKNTADLLGLSLSNGKTFTGNRLWQHYGKSLPWLF